MTTERLLLRPFALGDVEDALEYATSPEWGRYLPTPRPYTRRGAEEFVARALLTSWETHPVFAIVLDKKVIGSIALRAEPDHQRAELGYSIASYHWGKGLTPEAVRAVIGWGFPHYDLKKIYAMIDVKNDRSWRMAEKFGMVREGLLRSHGIWHGERIDMFYYGILRHEWGG